MSGLDPDQFCESCGARVAVQRNAARHRLEVDDGWAAGVSDRGLVHAANEDAMMVEVFGRQAVVVVADGVSTSAAPEVAALVAVEAAGGVLMNACQSRDSADTDGQVAQHWSTAVAAALDAAQMSVAALEWSQSAGHDAPSSTIVVAVWDGRDVTLGWAGDTRAYWVDGGETSQLTVDHSWAQQQIEDDVLSQEETLEHGRSHMITRWLGADCPDEASAALSFRPPGDGHLVICTDGLWNYIPVSTDLADLTHVG